MIIDTAKMTGVLRPIDHLGRFCVPAEFRNVLGITPGDMLETFLLEDGALMILPSVKDEERFAKL
jgi:AbrB family looped-hinge helix DNA binding protein